MSCNTPFVVYHEDGMIDRVRCGRCRGCRIRRKRYWIGRMLLEARSYAECRFITLTYAEDPGVLDLRDLQLFFKRYRRRLGEVRYFAVGEYGDRFGRGHWHSILFGSSLPVGRAALSEVWPAGFSLVGTCTPASVSYCASYVFKYQVAGDARRTLARMSLRPGLGFPAVGDFARQCAAIGIPFWPSSYVVDGKHYPMCEGLLLHFHKCYLDAGGRPPAELSPSERDALARVALWGSRIEEKRSLDREYYLIGGDRYAAPGPVRPTDKTR